MAEISKILAEVNYLSQGKCTLIAASKTRTTEEIVAAKNAGVQHFGENYVQEAISKIGAFKSAKLHLIGHLQRNKAKEAVKYFHFIHSVDSIKLADTLEKECKKQGRAQLNIFIQVKQKNESRKTGELIGNIPELVQHIQKNCPHLHLLGLMTVPPANENPEPYFKKLAKLNRQFGLSELSMGMSNDYELAIKNGATFVRIGRAIFGPR